MGYTRYASRIGFPIVLWDNEVSATGNGSLAVARRDPAGGAIQNNNPFRKRASKCRGER
jgi:hypothetical protein